MKRLAAAAVLSLVSGYAAAQAYPTKPVTVVVPWPAGGPSDLSARPVAKGLQESFKQPFVIDNRGGASGNIGTAIVAKAAPDGYTLLMTSSSPIVINPNVYKSMPFDAQKDLAPITNLLRVPLVLAVHPSVPVKNVKELIAWANANKSKAQYASAGNGTPQHMTGGYFDPAANLKDLTHVPYKGSAPAITDALGGHVPVIFDSTVAILTHLKAGKLIPIAITSATRSPQLPDVPTFKEQGLPTVEAYAWYGFFAPADAKDIIDKLNAEAQKAMKSPEYQAILKDTGSDYVGYTPANFAKFIAAEHAKWAKVAKDSGATLD